MKAVILTSFVFVMLLSFASCDKDKPKTKPVEFTSTTYSTLGTFDASGKPNYLTTPDVISTDLLAFIRNNKTSPSIVFRNKQIKNSTTKAKI